MLKAPKLGGETLYASAVHAYQLLSPEQKTFFETLQCEYRCSANGIRTERLLPFIAGTHC